MYLSPVYNKMLSNYVIFANLMGANGICVVFICILTNIKETFK